MEKSTILVIIMAAGIIGAMTFAASQKLDTNFSFCSAKYTQTLREGTGIFKVRMTEELCKMGCASHCQLFGMKYSCSEMKEKNTGWLDCDEKGENCKPRKERICICGCE